jgi:beta-lactamase superfamily II metal-dependent hydrolase
VFVDVGQGDAVVMRICGQIIVSNAGESRIENINKALQQLGATRIDVATLGHPHDDHVKNFAGLFAQWEIRKAVLSRSAHWKGTATNRAVMAAIRAEGLRPSYVRAGQTRRWGGARWQIHNPPKGEFTGGTDDAPNASIAYLLTVNGVRALFTGDIEEKISKSVATRLGERIDDTR